MPGGQNVAHLMRTDATALALRCQRLQAELEITRHKLRLCEAQIGGLRSAVRRLSLELQRERSGKRDRQSPQPRIENLSTPVLCTT
jgi:hypothetical protein